VTLLWIGSSLSGCGTWAAHSELIPLSDGWEIRWGNSPLNSNGVPIWVQEDSEDWRPSPPAARRLVKKDDILWARTSLPELSWNDPALVTYRVIGTIKAYQHGRLIYSSDNRTDRPDLRFEYPRLHFITIDSPGTDRRLFFRIDSNDRKFIGTDLPIYIVSKRSYVQALIKRFGGRAIVGVFLIWLGVIAFGVYVFRRKEESLPHLSFGALSLTAGTFELVGGWVWAVLVDAPVLYHYLFPTCLMIFPVGVFRFLELFISRRFQKPVRRLWQFHLAYAVLSIAFELTGVATLTVMLDFFTVALSLSMFVSLLLITKTAWEGSVESKIFGIGYGLLALTALIDLGVRMEIVPDFIDTFHFGLLAFVVCLGLVVERRYANALVQLKDYSHNLEDKVAARTEDLKKKNVELEEALHELEETQAQLVLTEKMASLGNLAAGIAHEVNNPIGAMNAAADVSGKCADRIEMLAPADEPALQKALGILKENVQVVRTAGKRVAGIVQTLKDFATLDRAEYQLTDIHADLDNNLVLLEHELKDKVTVVKKYGNVPPMECYRGELNQAFMTLLTRAARDIEEKGTIEIRTSQEDDGVHIEFDDTGRGMTREELNGLFDFSFKRQGARVGMTTGLTTVQNIVRKHEGEIRVESEVGRGTKVTMHLGSGPKT
jgi:signal transduction histidine kinase